MIPLVIFDDDEGEEEYDHEKMETKRKMTKLKRLRQEEVERGKNRSEEHLHFIS